MKTQVNTITASIDPINRANIGDIVFATKKPSDDWLPCDGTYLKVSEYGTLFNKIGYKYGVPIEGMKKKPAIAALDIYKTNAVESTSSDYYNTMSIRGKVFDFHYGGNYDASASLTVKIHGSSSTISYGTIYSPSIFFVINDVLYSAAKIEGSGASLTIRRGATTSGLTTVGIIGDTIVSHIYGGIYVDNINGWRFVVLEKGASDTYSRISMLTFTASSFTKEILKTSISVNTSTVGHAAVGLILGNVFYSSSYSYDLTRLIKVNTIPDPIKNCLNGMSLKTDIYSSEDTNHVVYSKYVSETEADIISLKIDNNDSITRTVYPIITDKTKINPHTICPSLLPNGQIAVTGYLVGTKNVEPVSWSGAAYCDYGDTSSIYGVSLLVNGTSRKFEGVLVLCLGVITDDAPFTFFEISCKDVKIDTRLDANKYIEFSRSGGPGFSNYTYYLSSSDIEKLAPTVTYTSDIKGRYNTNMSGVFSFSILGYKFITCFGDQGKQGEWKASPMTNILAYSDYSGPTKLKLSNAYSKGTYSNVYSSPQVFNDTFDPTYFALPLINSSNIVAFIKYK